ncbi:hypothetical protein BG006_008283 [Podila minutissima]|uniref:Mitochondrial adapter protein MCP1 transmembrane domain-containing protein n=1 Tax=Podila minutissima TaxID=64525 RepID=A0A9P5SGP1_9FUNG|nr:hypothetical protein BG006_008283 [Podila minutissima]
MSESIHTSDSSRDHDIELVEQLDVNSKYNTQTIRQKQGRQVVSSFTTTSSSSEDIAAEAGTNGETISGKKTTTTTKTTTHSKVPVQTFPSVGFYQGLGRLQAISGLGFSAFAFVHVIPPVLAAFGGVELANKALIWGRVYYHTYGVEQIAVFGTLGVHILTSLGRAVVRSIWSSKKYLANRNSRTVVTEQHEGKTRTIIRETKVVASGSSAHSSASGSAPGSFPYHRLAGWIMAPIVLGHVFNVRINPLLKLQDSAIIDYSFITYLHRVQNAGIFYVPLIALFLYHAYSNGQAAVNTVLPKGSPKRFTASEMIKSRPVRAVVAGVITTVGLVGLYRIISDPSSIPWQRQYAQLL